MTEPTRSKRPRARIIGLGAAAPEIVATNADLERIVDTNDEWITQRSGIKERHWIARGQKTSDLAIKAARMAFEQSGLAPGDIDMVILGTISPDMRFPATAIFVQEALGFENAAAWDISATCSGFLFCIHNAEAMIASGKAKNVLVIGTEMLTPVTDYTDRGTCVLFGDGAGSVVLTASDGSDGKGVLGSHIGSGGHAWQLLYCVGHGTLVFARGYEERSDRFIQMNGNEVFKHAVRTMEKAAVETLKDANLQASDIDWLVPHQANIRIIESTAARLKIPMDRVIVNIHKYGNTSSASIPLALDEARRDGRIKDGQIVMCVAFGGGFTWGGAALRF